MHQEKSDRHKEALAAAPAVPRMGLLEKARMLGLGAEVDEAIDSLGKFYVTRVLADALTGVPSFGKKGKPAKDSALHKAAYESSISGPDVFKLILLDMMVNASAIVLADAVEDPKWAEEHLGQWPEKQVEAMLVVAKQCRAEGIKSGLRLKAGDRARDPVEVISVRVRRSCWLAREYIGFEGVAEG